jgi:hypothetical protein
MAEERPSESVQKQSKKGISFFSRILIILIVILAYLLIKILLLVTGAPTISVDYVAEYSKITRPADYEPNQNAAPYYEKAFDAFFGMSRLLQSCRQVWPDDMNDTEQSQNRITGFNEDLPGHCRACTVSTFPKSFATLELQLTASNLRQNYWPSKANGTRRYRM